MNTFTPRALFPCLLVLLAGFFQNGHARGFQSRHGLDIHRDSQDLGQPIGVPILDADGHRWSMQGRLCLPRGGDKPQLVVINHGSPANSADRPGMSLETCDSEDVDWFVRRHYAVALVLRLGYGATGGPWTEGYGGCDEADFYRSGLETARQIDTIVTAVTSLASIDPNGVIVVGQSAGGWGTLAYDSIAHPHVAAFIDMAGGRGGHYHDKPDSNCHPEKLVDAAATYGKTATTPMLWIYTKNDSFFNPDLSASMYQAFSQAGGKAQFVSAGAFDGEGHHLFVGHGGSKVWGPIVEAYLKQVDPPEKH